MANQQVPLMMRMQDGEQGEQIWKANMFDKKSTR